MDRRRADSCRDIDSSSPRSKGPDRSDTALVFLVSINGVDQEVREVVVQVQLIVDEERAGREKPVAQGFMAIERQTGAPRPSAIARIERTESIRHQALGNGAQRNVRGVG